MSAAQHTPGPWTFGGNEVDWFVEPDGAFNSVSSQPIGAPNRSDPVCVVTQRDHRGYRSDDAQLEANARLIAAAPDMLDELTAQADGCSAIIMMLNGQSSAVAATLVSMLRMQENAARAAIAKAEGRP